MARIRFILPVPRIVIPAFPPHQTACGLVGWEGRNPQTRYTDVVQLFIMPMSEAERFKLYLSNTLEPDIPLQTELPISHDISEECALANKVKHQEPILVIMGYPPL